MRTGSSADQVPIKWKFFDAMQILLITVDVGIVSLALVDANDKCIIYDLGALGRSSDAGIFMNSAMKTFLEEHDGDFPAPVDLGSVGKVGNHIVKKRDTHSVRSVVENYFGILASRFRILLQPIYATSDKVKDITLAIMISFP
ncbi:unnamed protein product [Nippostrongylus brasiliensis]|uniref:DDE Tnp4 domain-containing protein n=1 Tax=Nippostrongylus brasiliensis TaxID=27835 RepID=A0A0N4YD48_NIPBR|nr:unnamed protein product [Nippostrongylus brasiliensis]